MLSIVILYDRRGALQTNRVMLWKRKALLCKNRINTDQHGGRLDVNQENQ